MNARLKILIIDNSLGVTGAFKSIFLIASQIPSCEFSFALPSSSTLINELRGKNIKVFSVKFIEISRSVIILFYLPALVWNSIRILRFIKREKISIVHVNDIYNMCGVLIKIFSPGTKVIYHIRLLPGSYVKRMFPFFSKLVFRFSDKIICNSQASKDGIAIESEKIVVIYNPVDREEKLPPKRIEQSQITRLLHLANFLPGKGHEFALEAFARAYQANTSLLLTLAGGTFGIRENDLFKRSLEKKAQSMGIDGVVNFQGAQIDVESIIKQANIILNFSVSESFSRVTLEALYYGVPVIVSNSGGPSEIIENGKTGMLVSVGDVDGMTKAILKLSADVQLQMNFSIAGREHVIRKFDARLIAAQMERVYFSVIA